MFEYPDFSIADLIELIHAEIERTLLNTPRIHHFLVKIGIVAAKTILVTATPSQRPLRDKLSTLAEPLYPKSLTEKKDKWVALPYWKYFILLKICSLSEHYFVDNSKDWVQYLKAQKYSDLWLDSFSLTIVDCALSTSVEQKGKQFLNKHTVSLFFDGVNDSDKIKEIFG